MTIMVAGFLFGGCTMLLVMLGCGSNEPAIAKANVKLVEKLRAAVTAKNAEWLESTAKQIETARQQGKLSDEENAALGSIVSAARGGQWRPMHSYEL